MAEKDITEKILESYNDVFSDIVNVLLFHGEPVIDPDELEDQAPRSYYKADGRIRELERDVVKRWRKGNIRLACIGMENQTDADADMPLRVIAYDGAEYRAQFSGAERYPVVTLVLYFGLKGHWAAPLSLKERLEIPEAFAPYVNDYKINLFEIAYLSREQVSLFRSDFRIVADYFVQMRENNEFKPTADEVKHMQEILQLLNVMTGEHRFADECNNQMKGVPKSMSDFWDRVENKAREEGRAEGREEGRQEILQLLNDMAEDHQFEGECNNQTKEIPKSMSSFWDRVENKAREEGRAEGREEGALNDKKETAVNLHNLGVTEDIIAKAINVSTELLREWIDRPSA